MPKQIPWMLAFFKLVENDFFFQVNKGFNQGNITFTRSYMCAYQGVTSGWSPRGITLILTFILVFYQQTALDFILVLRAKYYISVQRKFKSIQHQLYFVSFFLWLIQISLWFQLSKVFSYGTEWRTCLNLNWIDLSHEQGRWIELHRRSCNKILKEVLQ